MERHVEVPQRSAVVPKTIVNEVVTSRRIVQNASQKRRRKSRAPRKTALMHFHLEFLWANPASLPLQSARSVLKEVEGRHALPLLAGAPFMTGS
jgi:hypothetical protein